MTCVGIDLGGTFIKLARYSPTGECLAQASTPTGDGMGEAPPIFDGIRSLLLEYASQDEPVGISAPGLVARDANSIEFMPGRLHGLEGALWGELLQRPVTIINDAHAALMGEMWIGSAQGLSNVIMLTLGTGVGGAAVVDGRLLRGHIGRAGHFGHLSMDPYGNAGNAGTLGSLDDAIGNHSVSTRSGGRFFDTLSLVAAHQTGDGDASAVWLRSVRLLACGITSLINAFDPEIVVIGGGIAKAGDSLFNPLRVFLDEMEWRPGGHQVRILPATLGEWAGSTGAAWTAWKSFKHS